MHKQHSNDRRLSQVTDSFFYYFFAVIVVRLQGWIRAKGNGLDCHAVQQ